MGMDNRYWIFAGPTYEAGGGMSEYQGRYSTVEGALEAGYILDEEWIEVVDTETAKIVFFARMRDHPNTGRVVYEDERGNVVYSEKRKRWYDD